MEFVKEYPSNEPSGIDIVGPREILGRKIEIMAIEVLGIAEETLSEHMTIQSGQLGKIMTDISKLLFRSNVPKNFLVSSTTGVRDYTKNERNLERGYVNWQQIDFYEVNESVERL